ncbi:WD repeat-containing protein on Y chromosome [Pycnococcus provasolii]
MKEHGLAVLTATSFAKSGSASPAGQQGSDAAGLSRVGSPDKHGGKKKVAEAKTGVEERINMAALQEVLQKFQAADEDGSGGIEIDEFTESFGDLLGDNLGMMELKQLFMKIDADSNGSIDWDEFSNYLFLDNQAEKASDDEVAWKFTLRPRVGAESYHAAPAPVKGQDSSVLNKEVHISSMKYVDAQDKYVGAGYDGIARLYHTHDLTPWRYVQVNSEPTFLTDIEYVSSLRKLCVSGLDSSISFFDLGRTGYFENVGSYHITCDKMGAPTCMHSYERDEEARLIYGDSKGALRAVPALQPHSLMNVRFDDGRYLPKIHGEHKDWVTKVSYVQDLNAYATSSLDGTIKLCDEVSHRVKHTNKLHSKGIYSFVWCSAYSMFASSGLERDIQLWHGSTGRRVNVLSGHTASVLSVSLDVDLNRLISVSTDKTVKVWDLRSSKCLETISALHDDDTVANRRATLGMVYYHQKNRRLMLGTNSITRLDYHCESRLMKGHSAPLCGALYNDEFGVVVSADDSSTVITWRLQDGQRESKFQHAHVNSRTKADVKISSLSFDSSGRRLLTGASDGTLKMWNFNNGALLKNYLEEADSNDWKEISCVAYVAGSGAQKAGLIVASGWGHDVNVWEDDPDKKSEVRTFRGHKEDIMSQAIYAPSRMLATGDYGGRIRLWNLNSGLSRMEIRQKSPTGSLENGAEGLVFLPKVKHQDMPTLVSISTDSYLRLFSIGKFPGSQLFERWMGSKLQHNLTTLSTDDKNDYIALGCTMGSIRVVDISLLKQFFAKMEESASHHHGHGHGHGHHHHQHHHHQQHENHSHHGHHHSLRHGQAPPASVKPSSGGGPRIRLEDAFVTLCHFIAHEQSISSIQFISDKRMFLSSSVDHNISLWTVNGACVGIFGVDNWDLSDRTSWVDPDGEKTQHLKADSPPVQHRTSGATSGPSANNGAPAMFRRSSINRIGVFFDSPIPQVPSPMNRSSASSSPLVPKLNLLPPGTASYTSTMKDVSNNLVASGPRGPPPPGPPPSTAPPILSDFRVSRRGRVILPGSSGAVTSRTPRSRQKGMQKFPPLGPRPVKGETEAEMRRILGLPSVDAPSLTMNGYFRSRDALKERRFAEMRRPQTVHSKVNLHSVERVASTPLEVMKTLVKRDAVVRRAAERREADAAMRSNLGGPAQGIGSITARF